MNNNGLNVSYNQRVSFFEKVKVALLKNNKYVDSDPTISDSESDANGLFGVSILMNDLDTLILKTEKKFYINIILMLVRIDFATRELYDRYESDVINKIKEAIKPIESFYAIDGKGTFGVIIYGTDKVAAILKNRAHKSLHNSAQNGEFGGGRVSVKSTHVGYSEDCLSSVDLIFTAVSNIDRAKN